jgi:hypothetical protein
MAIPSLGTAVRPGPGSLPGTRCLSSQIHTRRSQARSYRSRQPLEIANVPLQESRLQGVEMAQPKLVNRVVSLLLQLPGVHRIGSADIMLLEVTGRKSGRIYQIPLGYARYQSTVFTTTDDRWWRNLRDGAPVRLLLARRWYRGVGQAVLDREMAMNGMRDLVAGCPRYAKWLNIARDQDGHAVAGDLARELDNGRIVIRITEVTATR